MAALLLMPFYIAVNIYFIKRSFAWMEACTRHFKKKWIRRGCLFLYVILSTAVLIAFFMKPCTVERFFKKTGNYFMGIFFYLILLTLLADLIKIIGKKTGWISEAMLQSRRIFVCFGTVIAVTVISLSVYGILNAKHIRVTDYHVKIQKDVPDTGQLKIVMTADLHLGYNIGEWQMRQMVKKINQQKPDLVCICGDIFDNEVSAVKNPDQTARVLSNIKSTYGVYACWGNHDINEKILAGFTFPGAKVKKHKNAQMNAFLKKAKIQMLTDESILIDHRFYLVGRQDASRAKKLGITRISPEKLTEGLDLKKPVIVMDHEPKEFKEMSAAGVDLDLSGHTHDGQMFPANFLTKVLFENSCGQFKKGNMTSIVTSGVGVWGPNMRVFTRCEITSITVNF